MRRPEEGRSSILRAALDLTASGGWEATSLHAVRQRAGVSNGTLFHHFPTRADLAGAVVAAAMAEHQVVLLHELHAARSAREAVTGVVHQHLRWVADNRRLAQLLLSAPPDALRSGLAGEAVQANRNFFAEVADWLTTHGWTGSPELVLIVAMWLGPAQYHARGWLAAPDDSLPTAATALADGAWRAIGPLLDPEDP